MGLAIYLGFFYEKKGEITISVDALSRVFDVHQPVGGLEISYAGENLRIAKKTLWSLSFTVRNSGNAEIKKSDFDDQVPFGLRINGASLVEQPSIKTKVDYLQQQLRITTANDSIALVPVIWEPGDEVKVDLLLLGSDSVRPSMSPVGKIAGIKKIAFIDIDKIPSGPPTWEKVLGPDSYLVQLARLPIYFIGAIVFALLTLMLLAIVISPIALLAERSQKAQRAKLISTHLEINHGNAILKKLADIYVERGEHVLKDFGEFAVDLAKPETSEAIANCSKSDANKKVLADWKQTNRLRFDADKWRSLGLVEVKDVSITPVDGADEANRTLCSLLKIELTTAKND